MSVSKWTETKPSNKIFVSADIEPKVIVNSDTTDLSIYSSNPSFASHYMHVFAWPLTNSLLLNKLETT